MTPEHKSFQHFADTFSFGRLINYSSCIDLIFTNRKSYLKNTFVPLTGISDFHKLTKLSLKSQILKVPSKI